VAQTVFQRFAQITEALLDPASVRTVVEVGARDCAETLDFHRRYPNARIIAFECNAATLPVCRRAVARLRRIKLIEKAVSDRAGDIPFYPIDPDRTVTGDAEGNPGASSLFRASGDYPLEHYAQRETTVQAVTLAQVMREEGLHGIDLLWMDIQGAELLALRGLGDRLGDVRLIHLEVEFFRIYAGQPLFEEVHRFLLGRGFALLGFTSYSRFAADAVYAQRSLLHGLLARWRLAWRHRYLLRNRLKRSKHRLKGVLRGYAGGLARKRAPLREEAGP
jgi:FkbM family methyltransferase